MQISEQELRTLIRDAIARHTGGEPARDPQRLPSPTVTDRGTHASHHLFPVAATPDGECVIEPGHRCDHCGYCKSLGH